MVRSFQSALGDMLQVQRTALDEYNFEARQSAKHGNEVYLQLHNHFNNALLSFYGSFVSYSRPAYKLLAYPKAAPRFAITPPAPRKQETSRARPFKDAPLLVLEGEGEAIPAAYRPSVLSQAEVLMNILKEMDALSIELIGYTREKEYEKDDFKRSDEILARYHYLIGQFDDRKEQLYRDVRRIYESYPPVKADDAWYVAGQAMLRAVDLDKALLFGVRDYLGGRESSLPDAAPVEAEGRKLIKEEYKIMKGLERLGRNNGNCPYTYYEDIAENSIRLARMTAEKMRSQSPYESYYYFYNNQLVHNYNRYPELAQPRQLKNITQLNLFVMNQQAPFGPQAATTPVAVAPRPEAKQAADPQPVAPATSMNAPQQLPLLKKSVKALLQLLRPTDQVSIVVYSGKARVALEAVTGADTDKISQAIDALHSDGGTDGNAGIRLAYKLANRHYLRGGNNRIVLATDGEFPVGAEVHEVVEANAREDVFLTVFHFSPRHAASPVLQQLAEKGRGTYTHITPENADARLLSEAQAKKAH
jgi:hypothetical protein